VGCNRLASIEVDAANPNYRAEGNCCLTKNGKTLVFGCKTSSIPQGVERIDRWAFGSCEHLDSIEIPSTVTKIEQCAFDYCPCWKKIILLDSYERPD